jgi:hypothetical protein
MTLRSFFSPEAITSCWSPAVFRVLSTVSHGLHQLRIAKIIQETPDARSFVLKVPATLPTNAAIAPGSS